MTQGSDTNLQVREFFQYAGTLSTADAITWLTNMEVAWRALQTASLVTGLALVLSELTDLTSTSAPQVQNSTGGAGGNSNPPNAAGVALVIRKKIARRYRGGHPRIYIPGTPQGWLTTANQWDSTQLGTLVGNYTTFINACIANTNPAAIGAITHINISYYSGFTNHTYPSGRVKAIPTPRATPLVDAIIGVVGNPKPASQRRRNEQA
jgi:hypothetical protein